MRERFRAVLLSTALALVCVPATAFAQTGNIAGTVRDVQGGVMPGVTVEVTSPQLIEKVRSAVTDQNGRYQITSLPVGVYKVTFTLDRFATAERTNIELSSDFTAPVNAEMKLGGRTEVVTVVATATMVDGVNSPAMIRPMRKATTVESATVTKVKRFDMVCALTVTIPTLCPSRQQLVASR